MIHVRDDWDVEFWENSTEAFDILHEQEKKPSQMEQNKEVKNGGQPCGRKIWLLFLENNVR